ncbi:MAG TPA: hypothetical protein VNJ03_11880 [Vicinamibacterales bacterium]|nr:hypothetical protein [Vicinamibacterales bacterium]
MAIETVAAPSSRPRNWLFVALALVVGILVLSRIFSAGSVVPAVSSTAPPRQQARGGPEGERVDPAELDVHIEALRGPSPSPMEGVRNPFRFRPAPPPPAPPPSPVVPRVTAPAPVLQPVDPGPPPGPPPPPRIGDAIKFIGIVETAGGKIGAFSDCRATFPGREGDVVEGRYRVVRIGIESAVLEYLDGRGRATLPLNGSACVNR